MMINDLNPKRTNERHLRKKYGCNRHVTIRF